MASRRKIPARRRARTQRRKPVRRSTRRKNARSTGIITKIARNPVPDRYFTKIRYNTTALITTTPFSIVPMTGYYQYRASVFDPDLTGIGHQPMWYDQMTTLYTKYRVHGIGYKLTIACPDNNRLTLLALGIAVNGTTDTSWDTLTERKETRVMRVPPTGAMPVIYKGYIHNAKAWGLSKKEFYDDDQFIAYNGVSPTKTTVLSLYGCTHAATDTIDYALELTFYVEFIERVKVSGS